MLYIIKPLKASCYINEISYHPFNKSDLFGEEIICWSITGVDHYWMVPGEDLCSCCKEVNYNKVLNHAL